MMVAVTVVAVTLAVGWKAGRQEQVSCKAGQEAGAAAETTVCPASCQRR